MTSRTAGPVLIVGAGLLGASVGLALRATGVEVFLEDVSRGAVDLAADYGAGVPLPEGAAPEIVVVAVPPDQIAEVVARCLDRFPGALVTDVGSVKQYPLDGLRRRGADLTRYLGSHPLAGRERGGAASARADLFLGRPWVLTPHEGTTPAQLHLLENLVVDAGGTPIVLSPEEHDVSVGLISHVPQLVASVMAARLIEAPSAAVTIAGQGLRDVTRIASSSPELWVQILGANADAVVPVLDAIGTDVAALADALRDQDRPGARRAVAEIMAAGNAGVARLPGKHGQDARYASLVVLIDDKPGQLARLLTEIGDLGVNLEDFRLEHSPEAPIGIAEVAVLTEVRDRLERELTRRGWRIAG